MKCRLSVLGNNKNQKKSGKSGDFTLLWLLCHLGKVTKNVEIQKRTEEIYSCVVDKDIAVSLL